MNSEFIKRSVMKIINFLPPHVMLVAAAKTRNVEEVQAAVDAGVKILGYNYLQEAEKIYGVIGDQVQWHMIGHLQKNKAKKAVTLFDMIETVDSLKLAKILDKECEKQHKKMPVLIEINIAKEHQKSGVLPENALDFARKMSSLSHLKLRGLMTMGPFGADSDQLRMFFKQTKSIFDQIKNEHIPNIEMQYLSMGMSDSYEIAVEEGANIIRIGTKLFGKKIIDP